MHLVLIGSGLHVQSGISVGCSCSQIPHAIGIWLPIAYGPYNSTLLGLQSEVLALMFCLQNHLEVLQSYIKQMMTGRQHRLALLSWKARLRA